jgi:hypothetical protein
MRMEHGLRIDIETERAKINQNTAALKFQFFDKWIRPGRSNQQDFEESVSKCLSGFRSPSKGVER